MAKSRASARAKGGSMLWLEGLVCGAVLAFAPATAVLLMVLLAPALLCLAVDTEPGRGMTRAVTLACVAGSMGPAWHLWMAQDRLEEAVDLIWDPMTLLLAWGGGACAWAMCQVFPAVLQGVWNMREAVRGRAIEAEIKRLRDEWFLD
jgi:hypothetical protein